MQRLPGVMHLLSTHALCTLFFILLIFFKISACRQGRFCMHRGIVKIYALLLKRFSKVVLEKQAIPLITSVNNHKNTGKAFGFQSLKRGVMGLVWLSAQIFVWLGHNRKHISTKLGGGALMEIETCMSRVNGVVEFKPNEWFDILKKLA